MLVTLLVEMSLKFIFQTYLLSKLTFSSIQFQLGILFYRLH